MKNWFLHIMLLAGLFGVLTTSCSQEEGLEPQVPTEKIPVSFSIALNNSSARSRADETGKEIWGNNYDGNPDNNYSSEVGNEFENFIDPNLLKAELTLYNLTDNVSLPCEVVNITIFETGSDNVYQLVGEVNVNVDITDYTVAKLNVYANFDTNGVGQMLTAFGTDYTGELIGKGRKCIPMWGVKTIDNFSLTPGGIKDLGPIYLLRAMSKIEVTLHDDLVKEGYKLEGAYLGKYKENGNIRLNGYNDIDNTLNIETINSFNEYTEQNSTSKVAQSGGLDFISVNDYTYCIYVPECSNYTENDLIQIKLLKEEGQGENKKIDYILKDNTFPSFPMNITNLVRNHLYRYTIKSVNINTEVDVTLQYQVMEWTPINNGSLTFGGESGAIHNPNQSN